MGDDFIGDSDGDTEVQSEDGTWRPITEHDLIQYRQQDDSHDDAGSRKGCRRPSNREQFCEDNDRAPHTGYRGPPDRHQNFDDDDRAPKSPRQTNKTHHAGGSRRSSLDSNREMNVSLTPRGHDSPRSDSNVRSKKVELDCRYDQDDIGNLKWGFNDAGAYLKRLPDDLSAKFGLYANDVLVQINGKNVRRKPRAEIENCWMDAQEEDALLRLVLEGNR